MFAGDLRVTVQRRRRQPVLFLNMRHYSLPSTMMTSQTLQRCRSPSTVAAPACTTHAHELLDPIMAVVWCMIFFWTWEKSTVTFLPKERCSFWVSHLHPPRQYLRINHRLEFMNLSTKKFIFWYTRSMLIFFHTTYYYICVQNTVYYILYVYPIHFI